MPNLITHQLFGQEVLKTAPPALQQVVEAFPKEFNLGTQGPDLFFYYNAWPWLNQKKSKELTQVGSTIHQERIGQFFQAVLEDMGDSPTPPRASENPATSIHPAPSTNQAKLSYLCGFLCHWALDTTTHPYIFNQTGYIKTKEGSANHHRFESHLDYLILQELKGVSLKAYPGYKLVESDKTTVEAIFDFYQRPLQFVHNYELSTDTVKTALKHFRGIQRILFDPKGRKFRMLHWIEKRILRSPYLFTSMITLPLDDSYDILNKGHRSWQHPCTGEARTDSFLQLFDKAVTLGTEALGLLEACVQDSGSSEPEEQPESIERNATPASKTGTTPAFAAEPAEGQKFAPSSSADKLLTLINNRSFETGLSTLEPMKFFSPVY